ncbi:MAG: hypothetical protein ABJG41_13375 [Cyclobacteriaceae bacterium]
MSKILKNRFDRIVNENLPKQLKIYAVLAENPLHTDMFHQLGIGLKTVLKKLGRIDDFKGIYILLENCKPVYIDESSNVLQRILQQFKGSSKYQRKLAHTMANIKSANNSLYTVNEALEEMKNMNLVLLELPDDLEREITKLYLQCHFDCMYNIYE